MRYAIRGGRIIDPVNELDCVADLLIDDGVIDRVIRADDPARYRPAPDDVVIDARDKLVVPGLIDVHTHVYKGVSSYGLDPDRAGVQAAVTHVNDLGSAGWLTIGGLQALVAPAAETAVTCFVNLLAVGLSENWGQAYPSMAAYMLETEPLIRLVRDDPDLIVGIKLHVERGLLAALGLGARELLSRAIDVGEALNVPLYVHLGDLFPIDAAATADPHRLALQAVEALRPGDILGHCFTPHAGGLVGADGTVSPAAMLASERGILHEVGHGWNFSFERARRLLDAGVTPDIISSDIHGSAHVGWSSGERGLAPDVAGRGLAWSMVGTMSKVLALGVPLHDVIRMSTVGPARALGLAHVKGALTPGRRAEVSILDLATGAFVLRDSTGAPHDAPSLLLPAQTVIGDKTWECEPFALPEFRNDYLSVNPSLAT